MFSRFIHTFQLPLLVFCVSSLLLTVHSCSALNNENDCERIKYPPNTKNQVTINQGVWGDLWFWEGDFQPICINGKITPVEREIYIHEATPSDSVERSDSNPTFFTEIRTRLIKIVGSNYTGFFEAELDTGVYSFFVKEDSLFYADGGSSKYIRPAYVAQDSVTHIQIDITYRAAF